MLPYRVKDGLTPSVAAALEGYDPFTQQLLATRGVTSLEAAEAFLSPDYETQLHDPELLHDIDVAVARIFVALENKEPIVIFSDYDCDGIPGAVVLHDCFTAIGCEHFSNYIPHRHYEGFGLSVTAVEKIAAEGGKLIVTIDCGTTDHAAVARANELGVDVIITDHHEPMMHDGVVSLPEAVAVVNPKLGAYPFGDLCGAAVAYKLAQVVLRRGVAEGRFSFLPGREKWWLDMVGLATVADMVPLLGENRVLAHFGLQVLKKSRRPGLQQLLRMQRVNPRFLTEDDIGFTIGPRINAASRMDTPEDAFHLLATSDEGEAGARAAHLEKLNNERRGLVASMTKEAHHHLRSLPEVPSVIVLGNPAWRPALAGLVANKLAEEHSRAAFVWGRDGNGVIKGSCRSGGTVSVVRLMESIADYFIESGGHHGSGGFSVIEDKIHTLTTALNEAYTNLGSAAEIKREYEVDGQITLDEITERHLSEQQRLAPFGAHNPKPLLAVVDAVPVAVEVFGKTKEHTKLRFATQGIASEAIAFFCLPERFTRTPEVGQKLTLLAHLEESYFMGRVQTRLRLVDIF